MRSRSLFPLLAAVLSLGLLPKAAHADTLTLTLNSAPSVSTQVGGTVDYFGTLTAASSNTGDEYLNGDSFNILSPLVLDDTAFFESPLFLAPGQSYTGLLFDVVVPANTAVGLYSGSFSVLGGSTANATDTTATANFTTAVTPEPSTLLLLGTGVLGLGVMLRRRNQLAGGSSLA